MKPRHQTILVALAAMTTSAMGQASFQGLGDLPGGGVSEAYGVSADGAVVVGYSTSTPGRQAFRWTSGKGMVGLGDLLGEGFESFAHGASADGAVVVGQGRSAWGIEAFRWTSASGMVGLNVEPFGGIFAIAATDVSADGAVVVGWGSTSTSGLQAFRWTSGEGVINLGNLPGGRGSQALGISADGAVVVGFGASSSGRQAFRWTSAGGMVGLGDLPGFKFDSLAYDVSADGAVVVGKGFSASGIEAFRWTSAGGMVGLGNLPGTSFFSVANGVSGDGSIVVGTGRPDSGGRAFIWNSVNGMRNLQDLLVNGFGLDLAGWLLLSANGISDDGSTIVGFGISPNGVEGWIATIHEPIPTFLDIRPGECPNRLNGKSRGVLAAAVVGTADFDATAIDPATVQLSRADGVGGSVRPIDGPPGPHPEIADVASPFVREACGCHDLEGDGVNDLSLKFDEVELISSLELDETGGGSVVELVVRGELTDGRQFAGRDCVMLVPPADLDADGDVDGNDFVFFAACFNKAGYPPRGGCSLAQSKAFDFDDDGDVDLIDFTVFASCYNKSGNPPRTLGCP